MLKHMFLILVTVMAVTLIAQADSTTVSGVLTKVDANSIDVRSHGETSSIMTSADTAYRKWIMAKPWQQDTTAKHTDLREGMRVRVDVATDNPRSAKTVWIVVR